MKKLLISCVVLIIVFTGCSQQSNAPSKDDLKEKTTPSVAQSIDDATMSQQDQNQQAYKPSVPYKQGEDLNIVANSLITMYLEHYKTASDVPVDLKLKNYKIIKAEAYKSDEAGFMFNAIFSVLPEMGGAYVAGNGIIGDNGWVNEKCMFVKVIKSKNTYEWVDWGTSP